MLKGINPLITPELLKVLAEMGHDDAVVLADCNFTAERYAQSAQRRMPILRLPGIGMVQTVQTLMSLLPLEAEVRHPVAYMQVGNAPPNYRSALQREVLATIHPFLSEGQSAQGLERFAFYEQAQRAYAIVVTGEGQPFSNFILRKGVICEPLRE